MKLMAPRIRTSSFLVVALSVASAASAQHTAMPAGMTHEQHMAQMQKDAEMKRHGDAAMGFDQERTTHHFRMSTDGGAIEVAAREAGDHQTIAQVRAHLQEIAVAFKQGDFGKPQATHSEVPPGVPALQRLKDAITYTYHHTTSGGIVRIHTTNREALAAIHEFLAYQVREHKTGDPLAPPHDSAAVPR